MQIYTIKLTIDVSGRCNKKPRSGGNEVNYKVPDDRNRLKSMFYLATMQNYVYLLGYLSKSPKHVQSTNVHASNPNTVSLLLSSRLPFIGRSVIYLSKSYVVTLNIAYTF